MQLPVSDFYLLPFHINWSKTHNKMTSSATQTLLTSPTTKLISQGAEAASHNLPCPVFMPHPKYQQKVYKSYLLFRGLKSDDNAQSGLLQTSTNPSSDARVPMLLKYRFCKRYRHPALDAPLTRARVAGEARAIIKCLR